MNNKPPHLVVVGFSQLISYKYIPCFIDAISKKYIDSYSIVDIENQREIIKSRIHPLELKPENVYLISDPKKRGLWADPNEFGPLFQKIIKEKGKIKAYIATEVKAHEAYLKYCVENGIDSLVEKPVIAPIKNNQFDPSPIDAIMDRIINIAQKNPNHKHSVMTLSRYHKIYNDIMLSSLTERALKFKAPLTSFHFRTAGGVWNLHKEYEDREDHPYKYGYGMLMHGAYHYIDLADQFLDINKLVFPDKKFSITLSSYSTHPIDQNLRIPRKISESFKDYNPDWDNNRINKRIYGETGITTTFCMKDRKTNQVITLGTISLEQTTVSVRSWKELPKDDYNKNGRVSSVDVEAQLSTIYSMNTKCFDVPICVDGQITNIDATARITSRANASILTHESFNTEGVYNGLFHSDSNRMLINLWLQGKEEKSTIDSHRSAMHLTQTIAQSIKKPGKPITIDY